LIPGHVGYILIELLVRIKRHMFRSLVSKAHIGHFLEVLFEESKGVTHPANLG
jgi:hypothetical protein